MIVRLYGISLTRESLSGEPLVPWWHQRTSLAVRISQGYHLMIRLVGISLQVVMKDTHPTSCKYIAKLIFPAMLAAVSHECVCLPNSCGQCLEAAIAGRHQLQDHVRSTFRYDRCQTRGSQISFDLTTFGEYMSDMRPVRLTRRRPTRSSSENEAY